jgi:RAB protein geranylgeranyltransferase component A
VCFLGMHMSRQAAHLWTNDIPSVLSAKGKKVLHIDRNDHYGGYDQIVGVGDLANNQQ